MTDLLLLYWNKRRPKRTRHRFPENPAEGAQESLPQVVWIAFDMMR
jgi:hypothetical protein